MDKIANGLKSAVSLVQLHSLFQAAVGRFGFDCFVGGCIRDGARPAELFLLHWPGVWAGRLGEDGFGHPVVASALLSPASFTWDEFPTHRAGEPGSAFAVVEAFGWRTGLVVPVHGPGDQRGIVSLVARRLCMTADDRIWIEMACRLAYYRGRDLKAAANPPGLSGREGEALKLVACGLDDVEIARALHVTRATAHAHVERAKRRLGARSRSHAVAIAMSHRLI